MGEEGGVVDVVGIEADTGEERLEVGEKEMERGGGRWGENGSEVDTVSRRRGEVGSGRERDGKGRG